MEEEPPQTKEPSKNSPECRRLRELREQVAPVAQPKWRSKGGIGALHHGASSSSRLSCCSFGESVNDIFQCNNRLKIEENDAESVRIWNLSHNLGLQCPGDEGSLVRELDRLEVRDNEIKKVSRVGNRKRIP